ncbi:hypothetical protein [Methylobacterium radiotolerans]|nr:hypothetical protein [Methylobacterium radiotolerans]GEN01519.1 hypothetical protein MRA01_60580 [Methylobacterium radiotolerans]
MFEITGSDIEALSDGDLRALVALLCEADLRRRDLSTAAVTAGGNQDAADGGIDVRVALPPATAIDGFIPRPATGFQCKKTDMARADILREMRPHGVLRPAIIALAEAGGAYVIISSGANTTDQMLKERLAAMKEALHGVPAAAGLTLDFYDRTRIATWVRDHPAMTLWVRNQIGRSLRGWRPFGRWSLQPAGANPGYLLDETTRVRATADSGGDVLDATDGIDRIRAELCQPCKSVRLVGLSGVGKTRLAEALFDPEVGSHSLDPSLAIYADGADQLDPPVVSLASDLTIGRTRAILVIDNCPPETHRRLTEIVTAFGSTVSLLTIEYDIQDDEPEETAVFELAKSSLELIERLVAQRHPSLSQIDGRTIAECAGGNARIALALADAAPRRGSFEGLNANTLFERLFWQRSAPDTSLLIIAKACALLYSFEGETLDGDAAELPILGGLIGRTADEVYAAVAELKRRQLVQARGQWRAVLPHAIANRLAAIALQDIPRSRLTAALITTASDRILRSFSRRLGYLSASAEAQEIVRSWLAPRGLLGDVENLDELRLTVLKNVAPVAPEAVLSALEVAMDRATDSTLRNFARFARMLRALAYEPAQFERAVALLVRLARLPKENRLHGDAADILESLFPVRLSGTQAPLDLRLAVIGRLLESADEAEQRLGVTLLRAVMRTGSFTSGYGFEFGARSRDYGLHPHNGQEIRDWYTTALGFAAPYLLADGSVGDGVREVVARAFSELWAKVGQAAELTRLAYVIADTRGFWHSGWVAVRRTRTYKGEHLTPDSLAELSALEEVLRPRTTADKVRSVVLHGDSAALGEMENAEKDIMQAMAREAAAIARLAQEAIADGTTWPALLPEVAAGKGYRAERFGEGLAQATEAPRAIWEALVAQIAAIPEPGFYALRGFLRGTEQQNVTLARTLLDETLEDPVLAPWFPFLQAGTTLDDVALVRLHRALATAVTPIDQFSHLARSGTLGTVAEPELGRLLLTIGDSTGGNAIALEILHTRLSLSRNAKQEIGPDLIRTAHTLLSGFRFERGRIGHSPEDYELAQMARMTLAGDGGQHVVRVLCQSLMLAMARYEIGHYEYDELVQAMFEVHPFEMLDTLFSEDAISRRRSAELLNELPRTGRPPMGSVPDDVVLTWCDRDPEDRYPLAATFVQLFAQPDDQTPRAWTDLAQRLLTDAPDPIPVLEILIDRLHPREWNGSLAVEIASRLRLLDQLDIRGLPTLATVRERARAELTEWLMRRQEFEEAEGLARDGRFE